MQLEFDFGLETVKPAPPAPVILPYFAKPKTDNQRLLNYQYDYKVNGNKAALTTMYGLGYKVALKFIRTQAKKNFAVASLDESVKQEKAHNAIVYMVSRFLKVKDFAIEKSFTAYLYLRVEHELFYRRKVDGIVDFVDWDNINEGKIDNDNV
ncbi:MAG: hypothetical protein MJ196_06005 [Treponemataceae bacterium]|nr:hypothetical protein [Treponemataceae bacterium]